MHSVFETSTTCRASWCSIKILLACPPSLGLSKNSRARWEISVWTITPAPAAVLIRESTKLANGNMLKGQQSIWYVILFNYDWNGLHKGFLVYIWLLYRCLRAICMDQDFPLGDRTKKVRNCDRVMFIFYPFTDAESTNVCTQCFDGHF